MTVFINYVMILRRKRGIININVSNHSINVQQTNYFHERFSLVCLSIDVSGDTIRGTEYVGYPYFLCNPSLNM